MSILQLSPYIWNSEYACHHCHEFPPFFDRDYLTAAVDELFVSFGRVREAYGKPIIISSGYRCPSHNISVGGAYLSAHLFGCAFDLSLSSTDEADRCSHIIDDLVPDLRMGRYKDKPFMVHIDTAWLIEPRASWGWKKGERWIT